jgi:hypothetical protein
VTSGASGDSGASGVSRDQLFLELWVSLASLLRSYTAAHGLNQNRQATVELGEERITVRHGDGWLELERDGAQVRWRREDGRNGAMELTEAGRLRRLNPGSPSASDPGHPLPNEEEMDMVAEGWARELMA